MILRKFALAALATSFLAAPAASFAQEPMTPPSTAPESVPATGPAAPPPTLPGDPAPAATPAVRTAADVDADLTRLFGESASFKAFLTDLQKAVAAEDKKAVAKMVAYPFKTKIDGADTTFDKEADFVKAYDDIMKPAIVLAIRDQKYETLMATDMGVMIGSGQVWFSKTGTGDDAAVKIIAVNQNAGS